MTAEEFLRLYTGATSQAQRLAKNPFDWGDGTVAFGSDGTGPAGFEGYHSAREDGGLKTLMKDDWAYRLDEDGNVTKNKAGGNFFKDFAKDIAVPVGLSYLGSQLINGGLLGGGEAIAASNTAPLAASGLVDAAALTAPISASVLPGAGVIPALAGAGSGVAALASGAASAAGAAKSFGDIAKAVAPLAGAAIGAAASKDQEQTAEREPWKPAQEWMKQNIADGQALQAFYKANPFNDNQKAALQQKLGMLQNYTQMLPGLLDQINGMGGYSRDGSKVSSPIKFNTQGLLNPGVVDFRNPFGG